MNEINRLGQSSTCESVRPLLSPYIDGRTSTDEARQVELHLETCASCRTELAQLRLLVQGLQALPQLPVPRPFTLSADSVPSSRVRWSANIVYLRRLAVALAACLVLALGASTQMGGGYLSSSKPMAPGIAALPARESNTGSQDSVTSQAQPTAPAGLGEATAVAKAMQAPAAAEQATPPPQGTPAPTTAAAAAPVAPAAAGEASGAVSPTPAPAGIPTQAQGALRSAQPAPPSQPSAPQLGAQPAAVPDAQQPAEGAHWPLREIELALAAGLLLAAVGIFLGRKSPDG